MAKKKEPRIVRVEWLDAASALSGGTDAELEHVSDNMTVSVGFFLKKSRKGVFFSTDWVDGEANGSVHFVPNGMLKSLGYLGIVPSPVKKSRKEKEAELTAVLSVDPV